MAASNINDVNQEVKQNGTSANNGEATNGENGDHTGEENGEQSIDNVFQITVNLPHEPFQTQVMVSSQEQVQDIRQSIIDLPFSFQYSCFHLEHKGTRINDFVELSEVEGVGPDSEITLVEDAYNEKEARMHFVRVRELIGAAGNKVDVVHGISAGISLLDAVVDTEKSRQEQLGSQSTAIDDYDLESSPQVNALLAPKQTPAPKTVKSISLSSWNPPPYHLRTRGHLLYLQVTTNEGEQHHVTSHVTGFFVNKSTNHKFDPFPRPAPKDVSAHSLITLIEKLSPSFLKEFQSLQEYNSRHDPLTAFQLSNAIPASPWIVDSSENAVGHVSDITRSQESYLISGIENAETLRDWNEEFQSTRELPKEPVQERVFRERLTSKLFADYTEAATRGAILVARGEVPPLNPTEAKDAQIFVYNNVFFSFGADGVDTFSTQGGDEAARVATGKDVMGVKQVNQLDIDGLFTPGTVTIDYLGKRIVGQSIVPGIFKQREPEQNQIDYGGVDGKDVVAENEEFVEVFQQLSKAIRVKKHPVWDKDDKRHDLEGSVETKGLLGTDGRKYVLDLYRLTPLDVTWMEQHWTEGTDGSVKPKEKNYPHRMATLRPELVELYFKSKLREWFATEYSKHSKPKDGETKDGDAKDDNAAAITNGEADAAKALANGTASNIEGEAESGQERPDWSGFKFGLNPDVFCGQLPQTDEEKAEWAKDEEEVVAACKFLTSDIIPQVIHDLQEGDVGFPMDGLSLTTLLHKRGINVRYLGNIAELADKDEPRLQALRLLAIQEMIARGFKHVANPLLRSLPFVFAPACVSHLLNCFLGTGLNQKPKPETEESIKSLYPDIDFSFEQATTASIRQAVRDQVYLRYRYELGDNWIRPEKEIQMLREVSLKLGIQLEAKDYLFNKDQAANHSDTASTSSDTPTINGNSKSSKKKKNKNRGDAQSPIRTALAPVQNVTFHPENIQNLIPIVKGSAPRSSLPDEALEAGRMSIAQGQKELGHDLLLESLSMYEQIYGVLHPEVARAYYQLSSQYYSLDDKEAAAELARKAVIVSERTLGLDNAETVLAYLNLGLFEHATGNQRLALAYVRHALELWNIIYGPKHPDSITTINNAAVILQAMKSYHASRQWFEASLTISEEVAGKQSINTATLLFQLSQALALDKDMRGAVNRMRESFNIFNTMLGPEDQNTKEAENWLSQLTQNAVMVAKQAKDLEARRQLRRIQLFGGRAAGIAGAGQAKVQPPVGQPTAPQVPGGGPDSRSIDELLKYIEGDSKSGSSKGSTPKKAAGRGQTNPKRRGQRVRAESTT